MSKSIRVEAAEIAYNRTHESQTPNDEEEKYVVDAATAEGASEFTYIARFTKGLPHTEFGLLADQRDYEDFRSAIDDATDVEFRTVRLGPREPSDYDQSTDGTQNPPVSPTWLSAPTGTGVRKWESPTAGHVFDLQGPDAQSLAIPEAPTLESFELIAEMAEDYAMALLRDVPFSDFRTSGTAEDMTLALSKLPWFDGSNVSELSAAETSRRRLFVGSDPTRLFRGLTAGDQAGPFVSQFLLVGTAPLGGGSTERDGLGRYGALKLDMKVRRTRSRSDYMTTWSSWLDVQNGADVRDDSRFVGKGKRARYRHITTPRDLATYVHDDELYEAYLNAAFVLFGIGAPFDSALPLGTSEPTQKGFATFGGPHLLALLTEVSSRALKAVRYQKFNVHRRLRPEAVGGLLDLYDRDASNPSVSVMKDLHGELDRVGLLEVVRAHNKKLNKGPLHSLDRADSVLLPMAFPEGSPMHPAYGAGHGTVAGACVTVLKAWFDCDYLLPFAYEAKLTGGGNAKLVPAANSVGMLTVGGELDKLAANIANARNMAGVHYYSDYWESLLLGEKIAQGIMEEQMLTYNTPFLLNIPPFKSV